MPWKTDTGLSACISLRVAVLGLALACAGCQRSVPPNVTPPGETAAFSDPSPAAPAAPETETRK